MIKPKIKLKRKKTLSPPESEISLEERLIVELSKEEIDYSKVLNLANQIALQDNRNLRFSIDAGVVNRLGRELVAKKETAVAELIKNAYDADATKVEVSFFKDDEDKIVISDNGNGMSRHQLKNGYMRIATNDKVENPKSPKFERQRAGKKGIGRFAAQRLGHSLDIVTQTEKSKQALWLDIDWDRFESGKELFQIENHIESVQKEKVQGTTLTIKGLRDAWTLDEVKSVYIEILDLQQPFPLYQNREIVSSNNKKNLNTQIVIPNRAKKDDFDVKIITRTEDLEEVKIDFESEVYKYALAEIDAYVDENGYGYVSYNSKKLDSSDKNIQITDKKGKRFNFSSLRNVNLKAYYFIYKQRLVDKTREKKIRDLSETRSGIKVYRNGFRVSPYGEPFDDWIKLDASSRGRWLLPPHSNASFFGFVELIDFDGESFEETASREKLIETEELRELQVFAYHALTTVVLRIAAIRGRKRTPSQKNWKNFNKARKELEDVVAKLESNIGLAKSYMKTKGIAELEVFENLVEVAEEAKNKVKFFNNTYSSFQRKIIEEQAMLRILASLGIVIGEFTHEIYQTLDAADLGSQQLIDELFEGTEVYKIASELRKNIERFNTYSSYFGETVAANADRNLIPQNLAEVVKEFINTFRPVARSSDIRIEQVIESSEDDLITCPMHPSEWASILFNLYSNSQKAIIRAGVEGNIQISISSDNGNLYLSFSDNGDGIPEKNKELIFEPFFTTTREISLNMQSDNYIRGAGLGLKIVRDIIISYGGEIYLDSPKEEFSTTFIIQIPKSDFEV